MSLESIRQEHVRGALLGLLKDGTAANDAVLHDAVNAVKFVSASRDQVRDALRWLAEQGLVSLDDLPVPGGARSVMRVAITQRGQDFEAGRIFVEGVRRPSGD